MRAHGIYWNADHEGHNLRQDENRQTQPLELRSDMQTSKGSAHEYAEKRVFNAPGILYSIEVNLVKISQDMLELTN